jgi:hypothetical protein
MNSARTFGKAQADADAWLAGLRADDRYLEDIWGRIHRSRQPSTQLGRQARGPPLGA